MSVIVELGVRADDFSLGRFLRPEPGARIELETMVPAGRSEVPYFWLHDGASEEFEAGVSRADPVHEVRMVDEFDDRALYALEWDSDDDALLSAVREYGATMQSGAVEGDTWTVELRFDHREALSSFQSCCEDAELDLEVHRMFNPASGATRDEFGLTDHQREALELAVREGYYAIPREASTLTLAQRLEISDQATTERLRRAITTLVENTLLAEAD